MYCKLNSHTIQSDTLTDSEEINDRRQFHELEIYHNKIVYMRVINGNLVKVWQLPEELAVQRSVDRHSTNLVKVHG